MASLFADKEKNTEMLQAVSDQSDSEEENITILLHAIKAIIQYIVTGDIIYFYNPFACM